MILGDSKSLPINPWPNLLTASLGFVVDSYNGAIGGQSVTDALAIMDATLAGFPDQGQGANYRFVLLNWGANSYADEAGFESDYLAVIDKVHTKAPDAKVFLMRPWRTGYDAEYAAMHGWIDTIVAARAFTYVGPDEAVWLKGADNGATMTMDGVHYSTAGHTECAAQWRTVLGN